MASIGATASNNPILDDCFLGDDSPVLSQKPIFFSFEPRTDKMHDAIANRNDELNFNYSDGKTESEFKKNVRHRKLRGFIGNEYTVEEAMSKQFGPENIEARAFLEYYWEMKAKCLDAVENGRNSEVEAFQTHPLFSPGWLVPRKRDIRWYLKNEIVNEENESSEKQRLNKSKSSASVKVRGIPAPRDVSGSQGKLIQGKKATALKDLREPVVKLYSATRNFNELANKPAERRKLIKFPLTETRKPMGKSLPVLNKKCPINSGVVDSQSQQSKSGTGYESYLRRMKKHL